MEKYIYIFFLIECFGFGAGSSLLPGLFSSCGDGVLLSSCGVRVSRWLLLLQSTGSRMLRLQ